MTARQDWRGCLFFNQCDILPAINCFTRKHLTSWRNRDVSRPPRTFIGSCVPDLPDRKCQRKVMVAFRRAQNGSIAAGVRPGRRLAWPRFPAAYGSTRHAPRLIIRPPSGSRNRQVNGSLHHGLTHRYLPFVTEIPGITAPPDLPAQRSRNVIQFWPYRSQMVNGHAFGYHPPWTGAPSRALEARGCATWPEVQLSPPRRAQRRLALCPDSFA